VTLDRSGAQGGRKIVVKTNVSEDVGGTLLLKEGSGCRGLLRYLLQ